MTISEGQVRELLAAAQTATVIWLPKAQGLAGRYEAAVIAELAQSWLDMWEAILNFCKHKAAVDEYLSMGVEGAAVQFNERMNLYRAALEQLRALGREQEAI